MSKAVSGGCDCGSVCYKVELDPIFSAHCDCRRCQKASSGPISLCRHRHKTHWTFAQRESHGFNFP
jgi:hypothetical protein